MRVLVVEDEIRLAGNIADGPRDGAGYAVDIAYNGDHKRRLAAQPLFKSGAVHLAPMGRQLLLELGPLPFEVPLVMDRAYESDETRELVLELNMIPVVPPKSNRRELYRGRGIHIAR
jgi:DNA-binding response OmpR family regulator